MRRRRALVLGILSGLIGTSCTVKTLPTPPNLLLVTIDTFRGDRAGSYGNPSFLTGHLDRVARRGATFESLLAPRGQTWPSLGSLLTSRYPVQHGMRRNGQSFRDTTLTLPELLQARGYATQAILANSGAAAWFGFDRVREYRARDDLVGQEAIRSLHELPEPFFLWVHYFGPHRPFVPPEPVVDRLDGAYSGPIDGSTKQMIEVHERKRSLTPADRTHLLARYDGAVWWSDVGLGRLLRGLEREALAERTVVVVASDHGEELLDHHEYVNHSASVYESTLHVPWVVAGPGVPPGGLLRGVVEMIDVAPTILGVLGVEVPRSFAGRALAQEVQQGQSQLSPHRAFAEWEDQIVSLRTETHRYIFNPSEYQVRLPPGGDGSGTFPIRSEELYDRRIDPREQSDVVGEQDDVALRLKRTVLEWQHEVSWEEASRVHRANPIVEAAREELRALGYVQ